MTKVKKTPVLILLLAFLTGPVYGANPILFRISVENSISHVQTQYVQRFAQALESEMPGVFDVRFYHSAQLYGDREVVAAMARGNLEMAVPGTWQLDRYVPEISVFLLPQFFGGDGSANDRYLESSQGQLLIRTLENHLAVHIPGLWMDLGPAHVFTSSQKIESYEDFRRLRIRVAGGEANRLRIETFGGTGVIVAWTDLPEWLENHSIDGVLTSFETIRSASLWENGLRYVYTDYQYFPQYVPLVAEGVFRRLTAEQQNQFRQIWNRIAGEERIAAAQAQWEAREEVESYGIVITVPNPQQQAQAKEHLMGHQEDMVSTLGIDHDYLPTTDVE